MAEASPFWSYPGVWNGRIEPVYAVGQGVETGEYYYGDYYFGDQYYYIADATYSYYSDSLFCLGEDTTLQTYRFVVGEEVTLYQTLVDFSAHSLLYFTWKLRTHEDTPETTTILSAGQCEFVTTGLIGGEPTYDEDREPDGWTAANDGLAGIILPSDTLFTATHKKKLLRISGTSLNDGDYTLLAIPSNQGRLVDAVTYPVYEIQNGRIGILYASGKSISDEVAASTTIQQVGLKWVARAYVDDIERVELVETRRGRSWQRNYMTLHVSKLTGLKTVKFGLTLELDI